MIPIGDGKRRFGFAWMTSLLLLLGILVFLYDHFSGRWLIGYALVPKDIVYRPAIFRLGRALLCLIPQGSAWLEPIVNLVYFWVLGRKVEDACGPWGMLMIVLLSGVGGVASQLILRPFSGDPVYGWAGIVAGLMGAYMLLYHMEPIRTWIPPLILVPVSALLHLLYWAGLSFVNVDRAAISARKWTRVIFLEPNWPFVGAILIGLIAAHLFARRELLYYRTLSRPVL